MWKSNLVSACVTLPAPLPSLWLQRSSHSETQRRLIRTRSLLQEQKLWPLFSVLCVGDFHFLKHFHFNASGDIFIHRIQHSASPSFVSLKGVFTTKVMSSPYSFRPTTSCSSSFLCSDTELIYTWSLVISLTSHRRKQICVCPGISGAETGGRGNLLCTDRNSRAITVRQVVSQSQ